MRKGTPFAPVLDASEARRSTGARPDGCPGRFCREYGGEEEEAEKK